MIISHKYKFIFIHIPKTAGTFLWKLLKNIDNDIIEIFKRTSKTTMHHKGYEIEYIAAILDFDYTEYTSFCVVRNPYDLYVSLYEYISRNPDYPTHNIVKNLTFQKFIKHNFNKINMFIESNMIVSCEKDFLHQNYVNQYEYVYENGVQKVDKILRFENLQQDLFQFFDTLEICKSKYIDILNIKINSIPNDVNYLRYYTKDVLNYLHTNDKGFVNDLKMFGYTQL